MTDVSCALNIGELYWVWYEGDYIQLRLSSIIIKKNLHGELYLLGRFDSKKIIRSVNGIHKDKPEV